MTGGDHLPPSRCKVVIFYHPIIAADEVEIRPNRREKERVNSGPAVTVFGPTHT